MAFLSATHLDAGAPSAARRPVRRSNVRAFERSDISDVAALFMSVFRAGPGHGRLAVERDLATIFFSNPTPGAEEASLVHVAPNGRADGFLAVFPSRFRFGGEIVTGASLGMWMAATESAGARAAAATLGVLLRRGYAFLLTDTANRRSLGACGLRDMRLLAGNSLRWSRPLALGALALDKFCGALPARVAATLTAPLAMVERSARRAASRPESDGQAPSQFRRLSAQAFAERFCALGDAWSLRPLWSPAELTWRLAAAGDRPALGPLLFGEALDPDGVFAGAYAYHLDARGRATALHVLARPRHEATTLAALIADADSLRALSVSGVTDPRLMRGLFVTKGVRYRHTCSTLFLSSRADILQAALGGDALLGGLIGDGWTPLSSEPYR